MGRTDQARLRRWSRPGNVANEDPGWASMTVQLRGLPSDGLRRPPQPQWDMKTLRHERLLTGGQLSDLSDPLWSLVLEGSVMLETAADQVYLQSGDAVILGARTAHRFIALEVVEIAAADLRPVVPAYALPSPWVVRGFGTRHPGVVALVERCPLGGMCDADSFAESYASLIGAAVTSSWVEAQAAQGAARPSVLDREVAEIVSVLAARPEETWTLERMARLAHLSRSVLVRRFRSALGRSPMEVLRDLRMREARTMLRDPSRSVTHVAYALGYSSGAAFTRAFAANHEGVTPREWRMASITGK
jgi:AraC-like DNA-binding protein